MVKTRRAYVTLPIQALIDSIPQVAQLPPGTEIISPVCTGHIEVYSTHPDLPEVEVGTRAPEVSPLTEVSDDGRIVWRILE